jgi:hypothetical protein
VNGQLPPWLRDALREEYPDVDDYAAIWEAMTLAERERFIELVEDGRVGMVGRG